MEGAASGELGNDILDLVFSPAGRAALIVIAVTLVLRAFRPRRRGKKPARDSAWLMERLKGKGFAKWIYVDLVVYLALGGALGLAAFFALHAAGQVVIPAGYAYLFLPDRDWIMVPALFLGISLPGFLWLPAGRMIHGKRFRKYVLYVIARQNADTRPFIKWGCTPIAILSVAFAVQMSRAHIGLVRNGAEVTLVQQDVLAFEPERYAIRDVTGVYYVARRRAPNGNIVDRPYVAVTFTGGNVWTSAWVIGGPKDAELVELTRRISGYAKMAVVPRILFGEDDPKKKQLSRP